MTDNSCIQKIHNNKSEEQVEHNSNKNNNNGYYNSDFKLNSDNDYSDDNNFNVSGKQKYIPKYEETEEEKAHNCLNNNINVNDKRNCSDTKSNNNSSDSDNSNTNNEMHRTNILYKMINAIMNYLSQSSNNDNTDQKNNINCNNQKNETECLNNSDILHDGDDGIIMKLDSFKNKQPCDNSLLNMKESKNVDESSDEEKEKMEESIEYAFSTSNDDGISSLDISMDSTKVSIVPKNSAVSISLR